MAVCVCQGRMQNGSMKIFLKERLLPSNSLNGVKIMLLKARSKPPELFRISLKLN